MSKAILIKGVSMPEEQGFLDLRIYGNGSVLLPCGGETVECKAEEVETDEE